MAIVVPTVLAATPEDLAVRLSRAEALSKRLHIDICDGRFADNATVNIERVHPSGGHEIDLHLMVREPSNMLHTALSLRPRLIIVHAESHGDLQNTLTHITELGIKTGVAILPETSLLSCRSLLERADHVLVFTGSLGHNGGEFQADQLNRIKDVRSINHRAEISIDGGVSDANVRLAADAGVDVIYVGSYLQDADDPKTAFDSLSAQLGGFR